MTRDEGRHDPFRALGLEHRNDLEDDDVRAAWRRVAAATHPDRADGGDPAAFAAAAGAYTVLRTATGRGEVLADMLAPGGTAVATAGAASRHRAVAPGALLLPIRAWRGRPVVLAVRVLAASAVCAAAVAAAGWQPASFGILAGMLT